MKCSQFTINSSTEDLHVNLSGCGDGSMYSQAIASAQPRVRVMLFVIVFTEKVNVEAWRPAAMLVERYLALIAP